MKKQFNLLDFVTRDDGATIAIYSDSPSNFRIYKDAEGIAELIDFLDSGSKNRDSAVIFTRNLDYLILNVWVAFKRSNKFEIRTQLNRNTVYAAHFRNNKTNVIKCLSKYISDDFEAFARAIDPNLTFNAKIYSENDRTELVESHMISNMKIMRLVLENMWEALDKYKLKWDLRTLSISGIAISLFLAHFNQFNLKISRSLDDYNLFNSSYTGARTEVFGNPDKASDNAKIFRYDFALMYGQAMKSQFFYGNYRTIDSPENFDINGLYCIECSNLTEDIFPPVLLIKHSHNRSGFTTGLIIGLYWRDEIKIALAYNKIKVHKIHHVYAFENSDNVFSKWADEMISQRTKSLFNRKLFKIMNSALYGRLGMRPTDTETVIVLADEYSNIQNLSNVRNEFWIGEVGLIELEIAQPLGQTRADVLLASQITMRARILLYEAMAAVILNRGRLLYVDTDEIIASFNSDVTFEKHGPITWPNQSPEIIDAIFVANKFYGLKYSNGSEIIRAAGVALKELRFDDLKNAFFDLTGKRYIKTLIKAKNNRFDFFEYYAHGYLLLEHEHDYSGKRVFDEKKIYTKANHFLNLYEETHNPITRQLLLERRLEILNKFGIVD